MMNMNKTPMYASTHAIAFYHKGQDNYILEKYEEAIASYDKAIELNPDFIFAFFNKGLSLNKLKRYEEAIIMFDKAIKLDPNHTSAFYHKGLALSALKRHEEAITMYDKVIELDSNNADSYIEKGNTLYVLNRYAEAIIIYDIAIQLNPSNACTYNGKGMVFNKLKRYEEAREALDKAIELSPSYSNAYANKGITLYALKRYEEAIVVYNKTLELSPNDFYTYFNKGLALYTLKRYEEAIIMYNKAIDLDSAFAGAFYNKGVALYALRRYEEAVIMYNKATDLDPAYPHALHNKELALNALKRHEEAMDFYETGRTFDAAKCYEEAINRYNKAIALDPNDARFFYHKGMSLYELKRFEAAKAMYDKGDTCLGPSEVVNSLKEAMIKEFEHNLTLKFTSKLAIYDKSSAKKILKLLDSLDLPKKEQINFREAYLQEFYRSSFLFFMSDYSPSELSNAIMVADNLLKIDSNNSLAYLVKAQCLKRTNSYPEAINVYKKYCELNENDQNGWEELGLIYRDCYKYKKAELAFKKALEISANNGSDIYKLHIFESIFLQGRTEEAMLYLSHLSNDEKCKTIINWILHNKEKIKFNFVEKALEILSVYDTKHKYIFQERGKWLEKQGKYEEAIKEYRHHLKFNQDDTEAQFGIFCATYLSGKEEKAFASISIHTKDYQINTILNLAKTLTNASRHEEALKILCKGSKLFPEAEDFIDNGENWLFTCIRKQIFDRTLHKFMDKINLVKQIRCLCKSIHTKLFKLLSKGSHIDL